MLPYGLRGVKITLDGDRDTHNRMRPLRGGQGTFDRIVENIRRVAGRVRIAIGGNFDESSVDSYPGAARVPARAGLRRQARQGQLQADRPQPAPPAPKGMLPLTPVDADGKPLGGTCMTSAGAGRRLGLRLVRLRRREDVVPARGDQAPRVPDARRRARRPLPRAHDSTRTPSVPTVRSTRARASPARRASRPGTSTTGAIRGARRAREKFDRLSRGASAATARSSRCVPGDAWSRRTQSLAT